MYGWSLLRPIGKHGHEGACGDGGGVNDVEDPGDAAARNGRVGQHMRLIRTAIPAHSHDT